MPERSILEREIGLVDEVASYDLALEARTPSYCAGCPHRGTSSVIMELRRRFRDADYMQRVHRRGTIDIVANGGIGCYSLNFLPPFRDMHNMPAMGLSGAAGLGAQAFSTNKHYVLCGDSTFFHSEITTLSNAIKCSQDILYIILDNKNTAMTGHQGTPASAYDVMGYKTIQQDIESVVRGLDARGGLFIRRTDPSQRDAYMLLLEQAFLMDGVRVIIADRECGITFHKKKRAAVNARMRSFGFLRRETHINITPAVCENCRECTKATACPGLTIEDSPHGEKIGIDMSLCVYDKYCTRIKACPSFEQVIITRRRPPVEHAGADTLWTGDLPDPAVPGIGTGSAPGVFSVFIPGVGGMGLGFVARLLTEAGAREGYRVNYYHQKGLAQRNGAVVSHVLFSTGDVNVSQRIPDGKADVVLGLDYLETVRGLAVASRSRTAIVCNTARTPTIKMLIGEDDFPRHLEERMLAVSREEAFFASDFFALSEEYFGNRLHANMMMLGTAWQMGLLPLRAATIEQVVAATVRKADREKNLRAFRIGRRLAVQPDLSAIDDAPPAPAVHLDGLLRLAGFSGSTAAAVRNAVTGHFQTLRTCDDALLRDFARRYVDLVLHENQAAAGRWAVLVEDVHRREAAMAAGTDQACTRAVVWNLYKVTAIKDEVWVAHLLTSREKLEADMRRYNVDPARGDRIRYLHINRPHFTILGMHLEWDMKTRNWMLAVMKRLKPLRRLLPGWHRREKAFRDWYRDEVVAAFVDGRITDHATAVEALELPAACTGYRDVVYPKHEAAMARWEVLMRHAREAQARA